MATVSEKAALSAWYKLMDNCKYLGVEHRYKEREYGIEWRALFKCQMIE